MRSVLLGALLALALMPCAEIAAQTAMPDVAGAPSMRRLVEQRGRISVIAELPPVSRSAVGKAANDLRRQLTAVGVTEVRPIGTLPFVALEVDRSQLAALLASGAVVSVSENRTLRKFLMQSVPLVGGARARAAGASGAGQAIVIVDDGIDSDHPFFNGRVVAGYCSAPGCGSTVKETPGAGKPGFGQSHGTHVAGIAAGRGSSFAGVAPEAKLISMRVFDDHDEATFEHLARGLDYIATDLAPRFRIAAVNMSLGDGGQEAGACDSLAHVRATAVAIDRLRAVGIASVVASGNNGFAGGIAAPACVRSAVAVGASGDGSSGAACAGTGLDQVASFSNSAGNVDVLAPGGCITSAYPGREFQAIEGTSMAAPHVAGAFAALRSKAPGASVDELEGTLIGTGRLITDPDNGVAKPRIDVAAALGALGDRSGWQAWASLVAGISTALPECEATGSRQIDCWVLKPGSTLVWSRWNGVTWAPWTSLGGTAATGASCVQRDRRIDCFTVNGGGELQQITRSGERWSGWSRRGGSLKGQPSCVALGSGGIDCFAQGTNNELWQVGFNGASWKAPRSLKARIGMRPACYAPGGSQIDCYVVARDTSMQRIQYKAGKWGPAAGLGGSHYGPPSCLYDGPKVQCFAQSRSNTLATATYDGARWSGWTSLGGPIAAQPTCLRFGATSGARTCLVPGAGGGLLVKSFDGRRWGPFADVGGGLVGRAVNAVSATGATIDVFGVGSNGALRHGSYR